MSQSPVPPVPGPPRPARPEPSPALSTEVLSTEALTPEARASQAQPSDVAQVLASLEQLDAVPVADHVAVFEQAHASLRRALDEAGAGPPARG